MSNIPLPTLPAEQVAEIQALYASGQSVGDISIKTGVKYTTVYFYAVSGGRPAPVEQVKQPDRLCWCGRRHYAKGLCTRHWGQKYYAEHYSKSARRAA